MTLETLQGVQQELVRQYTAIKAQQAVEKPVIQHTNCIELCGALQLIAQLIQQETIARAAPPGSTGPIL